MWPSKHVRFMSHRRVNRDKTFLVIFSLTVFSPSSGVCWSWRTSWWACPQTWPGEAQQCTSGTLQPEPSVSITLQNNTKNQLYRILRYNIIKNNKRLMSTLTKSSLRLWLRLVWSREDKFLKMIQIQHDVTEWLTTHLSLEELNEGLCEGLDPLVHDVVTLFRCVFIVKELNVVLLNTFILQTSPNECHVTYTHKKSYIVCDWSQK